MAVFYLEPLLIRTDKQFGLNFLEIIIRLKFSIIFARLDSYVLIKYCLL